MPSQAFPQPRAQSRTQTSGKPNSLHRQPPEVAKGGCEGPQVQVADLPKVPGPCLARPRPELGRAELPSRGSGHACETLESRLLRIRGLMICLPGNRLSGCDLGLAQISVPEEVSYAPLGPLRV